MRIALLSLVCLFGCSFGGGSSGPDPDPRPDAPTKQDAPPPIDAPIDAPVVEDKDPDRDGVPNPLDNCPTTPNTNQANDDADPRGDACDMCPWKANETLIDGDGDKLTDDCDPDPRYRDELLYFEGFDKLAADTSLPGGWLAGSPNGTWTVSTTDGTLNGTHPGMGLAPALISKDLGALPATDRLYVRTAGLFDNGAGKGQAGVSGDIDASGATAAGAFCDMTLDAGKSVAGFFRNGDESTEGPAIGDLDRPVALRLIVEHASSRVRCDIRGEKMGGSSTHSDDPTVRTGTAVGLRVANGSAAFRYVAVLRLNAMSQPPAAAAE
jgi:Thrombospondin type 3 repeat